MLAHMRQRKGDDKPHQLHGYTSYTSYTGLDPSCVLGSQGASGVLLIYVYSALGIN